MRDANMSFDQIKKDQAARDSELYSQMMGKPGEYGDLEAFEAQSAERRNEILFKINTDMEDTKSALKQAEALVARLKKRLDELQGMYRILTKK